MTGRSYVLSEVTWKVVKETAFQLAVLPWGATEPHNNHLPFGTDILESERIANEAARLAWEKGVKPLVLPAVPFGVNTTQLGIGPTINMHPSTQLQVVRDIVESLEACGIEKLLILNGHGGNDFRQIIREVRAETSVFLSTLNWWTVLDATRYFDEPGDHAGELETSLMLYLTPDLVLPLSEAGAGQAKKFRISGLREGWAWAPREWNEVTSDTGVGDPRAASIEKGLVYFHAVTEKIAEYLTDLANADLADLYD